MKKILTLFTILWASTLVYAQKYDFVVAQDGSGNFTTIQAAVDASKAFPDAPVTIFIKNGTYNEKVVIPGCNSHLRIIGESREKTILTYGDYFDKIKRGRNSTFYTYTLMVAANDFRIENMTIENSAGAVGQAVALHVEGDRCAFINCALLGNQDTLYLAGETSRDYFADCYIEGTTDFIFGAATAYFDRCTIYSKVNSYVTAASTPKGKTYGFVFVNCKLTAAAGVNKSYLGRPWRDFARVVFLHCDIGEHIAPEGWVNWDKTQRDKTAFYAEFGNKGKGALVDKRVKWSHQLTTKEAAIYTKEKVLGASYVTSQSDKAEWAK